MTFREENTLLVNAVLGVPSGFEYSQPKSRKTPKNTAFQYRPANSGNFRQIPANSGNFRQLNIFMLINFRNNMLHTD